MSYTKRCPDRLRPVQGCWALIFVFPLSPWDFGFGFSLVTGFCETIAWTWALKIRRLLSYLFLRMSHAVLKFASVIWREVKSFAVRHLLSLIFLDTATFDSLLPGCCLSLLHWSGRRRTSNPCSLHKKLAIPAWAVSHWWWPVQLLIVVLNFWLGFFCTWQRGWLGQHVVLPCRRNLPILWFLRRVCRWHRSGFELSHSCLTGTTVLSSTMSRIVKVVWAPRCWHFVQVYL